MRRNRKLKRENRLYNSISYNDAKIENYNRLYATVINIEGVQFSGKYYNAGKAAGIADEKPNFSEFGPTITLKY